MTRAPAEPPTTALDRSNERYKALTQRGSEIVRSLALAAIAIAWLLGGGLGTSDKPQAALDALQQDDQLYWVVQLAVATLALDLWQYTIAAALWGTFHWALDQALNNDDEATPNWRGKLAWTILRWTHAVQNLERREPTKSVLTSHAGGTLPTDWKSRRTLARDALSGRGDGQQTQTDAKTVRDGLNGWVPASLPRTATLLFAAKVLTASATYVVLGLYLT